MTFPAITLSHAGVTAQVVPARGAIVSSLAVGEKELLYLDRTTLDDATKNVRGGIPVLFPYAGKLADETLLATGTKMKQHGFGRNRPWVVREQRNDYLALALDQDADTRAQYPYDHEATTSLRLLARGLEIELSVENKGTRPMPLSPGWHPYFRCPAARKNQVTGDVAGFSSDQFSDEREFDFGLEAPLSGKARFSVPGLGSLRISFSPEMRHVQFWSQPGKDFVCIEPFLGPANTINTAKRLELAPGTATALIVRIELE
jgi:galactose mutarotase-like enzyme